MSKSVQNMTNHKHHRFPFEFWGIPKPTRTRKQSLPPMFLGGEADLWLLGNWLWVNVVENNVITFYFGLFQRGGIRHSQANAEARSARQMIDTLRFYFVMPVAWVLFPYSIEYLHIFTSCFYLNMHWPGIPLFSSRICACHWKYLNRKAIICTKSFLGNL